MSLFTLSSLLTVRLSKRRTNPARPGAFPHGGNRARGEDIGSQISSTIDPRENPVDVREEAEPQHLADEQRRPQELQPSDNQDAQ